MYLGDLTGLSEIAGGEGGIRTRVIAGKTESLPGRQSDFSHV